MSPSFQADQLCILEPLQKARNKPQDMNVTKRSKRREVTRAFCSISDLKDFKACACLPGLSILNTDILSANSCLCAGSFGELGAGIRAAWLIIYRACSLAICDQHAAQHVQSEFDEMQFEGTGVQYHGRSGLRLIMESHDLRP